MVNGPSTFNLQLKGQFIEDISVLILASEEKGVKEMVYDIIYQVVISVSLKNMTTPLKSNSWDFHPVNNEQD